MDEFYNDVYKGVHLEIEPVETRHETIILRFHAAYGDSGIEIVKGWVGEGIGVEQFIPQLEKLVDFYLENVNEKNA